MACVFSKAQTNTTCLVKYNEYKYHGLGTLNYWYSQEKIISTKEPNYRATAMRGFPVLLNEGMTTQTDTIKYNKEFNEFVNENKQAMFKRKQPISRKLTNENIIKMSYWYDYNKTNYIVLDTITNMGNWEILNDTATILGFKCQQATINYKNDKWFAWFTTQLPYNLGPEGFGGLPGLILKVSNVNASIGYEAKEIQYPNKEQIPEFKEEGENISRNQWLIIMNERNKKMYDSMKNMMENLQKQGAVIKQ